MEAFSHDGFQVVLALCFFQVANFMKFMQNKVVLPMLLSLEAILTESSEETANGDELAQQGQFWETASGDEFAQPEQVHDAASGDEFAQSEQVHESAGGDELAQQEQVHESAGGDEFALQKEVVDRQDRLKQLRELRKRHRIADGSYRAAAQRQIEESLSKVQGQLQCMEASSPRLCDADSASVPVITPVVTSFSHKRSRAFTLPVLPVVTAFSHKRSRAVTFKMSESSEGITEVTPHCIWQEC